MSVPQMQEDPVYDFPEPAGESVGRRRSCPQRGSLKNISVLDRLLLTHSVWLQLSINSATALHILHREPPGTFLVRKDVKPQFCQFPPCRPFQGCKHSVPSISGMCCPSPYSSQRPSSRLHPTNSWSPSLTWAWVGTVHYLSALIN
uniref:SH2 domain-containing protein n=1 Tax=Esox lucius TaxID=8010 RepID=A0AAY5KQM4_ESOLU